MKTSAAVRLVVKLLLLALTVALIFGWTDAPETKVDERSATCRYDRELGWVPIPNLQTTFQGSVPFHIAQNHLGFRDAEGGPKQGKRLLFLGDSYIWGYDAEYGQRFTELLEQQMPGWQVMNEGVSGYGTDQEYLMLRRTYAEVQPDVVVLEYNRWDHEDNSSNLRYGYFKPYFVQTGPDALSLRGVPVSRSLNVYHNTWPGLMSNRPIRAAFDRLYSCMGPVVTTTPVDPTHALLRELRRYCESHGARFYVMMVNDMPDEDRFFDTEHVPYVKLLDNLRYPGNGQHWTPEGHRVTADRLYRFLQVQGLTGSSLRPTAAGGLSTRPAYPAP